MLSLGRSIGLTEKEFWTLTLVEFNARIKAHDELQQHADFVPALLCKLYVDAHLPKDAEPAEISDFIPGMKRLQQPSKPQTTEQLQSALHQVALALGADMNTPKKEPNGNNR